MDESEQELRRHDPTGRGGADGTEDDAALESALSTASGWVGDAVSVVGVGALPDGAPCLVVHASDPTGLPSDVDGVPVVVVTAEAPQAQASATPDEDIATLPVEQEG